MSRRDLRLQDIDEEDTEEGLNRPLEIGGFVTPVKSEFTVETPKATLARDLLPDQAILFEDRPYEVTGTKHTMAKSGPLDSRYKVAIELIELFDKSKLDPLILRATEQLKRVNTARVRYTVLGIDEQIMTLQKQHRDPVERTVVEFHIPGGKIGSDLGAFFAQCDSDEEEDKPQIPITLLILEAVGRFQVIGFGIGDWEMLE